MRIKNIDELRERVIETFDKLSNGNISVIEAGVIAKLSETIISSLKTQMIYSRITETALHIPFMNNAIEGKSKNLGTIKIVQD